MDVAAATYIASRQQKAKQMQQNRMSNVYQSQGGAMMGGGSGGTGNLMGLLLLGISVYACYLSWYSNGVTYRALGSIAAAAQPSGFLRACDAMGAFFQGLSYLLYYYFSKGPRTAALVAAGRR